MEETRNTVASIFVGDRVKMINISVVCYNTIKFIDAVINVWNNIIIQDGLGNLSRVIKMRKQIVDMATHVVSNSSNICDKYIAEALYIAIMTYDNSTNKVDRPFDNIYSKRRKPSNISWFDSVTNNDVEIMNDMTCTLLRIREFAIDGHTNFNYSSKRSKYIVHIGKYIRSKYHMGFSEYDEISKKIDHILETVDRPKVYKNSASPLKTIAKFILRRRDNIDYN